MHMYNKFIRATLLRNTSTKYSYKSAKLNVLRPYIYKWLRDDSFYGWF